jgi:hypothetical protein
MTDGLGSDRLNQLWVQSVSKMVGEHDARVVVKGPGWVPKAFYDANQGDYDNATLLVIVICDLFER